jgi:hypothetical protein
MKEKSIEQFDNVKVEFGLKNLKFVSWNQIIIRTLDSFLLEDDDETGFDPTKIERTNISRNKTEALLKIQDDCD